MSDRLNEMTAIFYSYITVESMPQGLEFETNWVESTVFLDSTDLSFSMHGRDKEIVKIHDSEDFTTIYVQTKCYCDSTEVDYSELERQMATKQVSQKGVLDSNNKVRTDIKGDVITKTYDDYKEFEKGTISVSWYEIKKH